MSITASGKERNALPGDLAIWIFILAELLVFAVLFIVYAVARSREPQLFALCQGQLDSGAGLANTLVLITSSYFVVRAVTAIRANRADSCVRWLSGALVLGGLFLLIKGGEYSHYFGNGITLRSNDFYFFYLSLTIFHSMHVVMGMVILIAIARKAHRGGYSASDHTGVETGASYWHMVDMVWLILFPLIYMMR